MKPSIMFAAACIAFGVMAAPPSPSPRPAPSKLTPAERSKLMMQKTGGLLEAPRKGKHVTIINAAGLPDDVFDFLRNTIRKGLMFPLEVRNAAGSTSLDLPIDGSGLVIKIIDDPSSTVTLLTAVENGAALINLSALKKDSPSEKTLSARIHREVWRALVYTLGGGNTADPKCLMKTVTSLEELDSLSSNCPSPEVFNRVAASAMRFDVHPMRVVTYRKACKEGWAPAPTNDYQKAIWDEVHAMPTEPLKIKPETKKVRD